MKDTNEVFLLIALVAALVLLSSLYYRPTLGFSIDCISGRISDDNRIYCLCSLKQKPKIASTSTTNQLQVTIISQVVTLLH
jgi:hypothetical protein